MNVHLIGRWDRSLDHYPANAQRIWFLALTLIANITLYYQSLLLGSVAPLVQAQFHLSLSQYSLSLILALILGAFAALLGSLSDRVGRANLIIFGLLATGVCTLAMTFITSLWPFLLLYWVLGFIDGIMITTIIALIRDFSPRVGRAAAMGFWTFGPVGGSFLVTLIASLTLPIFHNWQSQYVIAGSVGLVAFFACLVWLRDLSPSLRDQVMHSLHEKERVEARASQIDVEAAVRHPWRQILRPRIVIIALGTNFLLLSFLVARSFFVIFLSSIFRFPLAQANGIASIFWVAFVIAAVVVGFLSDALRVRKPFLLIGALGLIVVSLLFLSRIGQPTSTGLIAVLLALMGTCIAIVYVPWLAAYTETVEDLNPALVATGAAVDVFLGRLMATIAFLALPLVVGSGQGWRTWWWVCIVGQVLFLPTIVLVSGKWNPWRVPTEAEINEAEANVG